MSINQKSGRQTFRRRFVSGSLFVSPCPPECNFQSETKIELDLRLEYGKKCSLDVCHVFFEEYLQEKTSDFILKRCREKGKCSKDSLRGAVVKNVELF